MAIQLIDIVGGSLPLPATFEFEGASDILRHEDNPCPPIWFCSDFLSSASLVLDNPGNSPSSVPGTVFISIHSTGELVEFCNIKLLSYYVIQLLNTITLWHFK